MPCVDRIRFLLLPIACAALLASSVAEEAERADERTPARIELDLQADAWREALEAARSMHARHPESLEVRGLLGRSLFRAGRMTEAENVLDAIESETDADPRALVTLARLRAAAGRGEDAARLADRAVRRAPDDPLVLFWSSEMTSSRASILKRLKRFLQITEPGEEQTLDPWVHDLRTAARGSVALYTALGDRPVWVVEQRPERLEIPLIRLWPGRGGHGYAIAVDIGGKRPVKLLLDTGSTGVFLVDRKTRKTGFEEMGMETTFGGGGDRRHRTRRGTLPRLAVGDLVFGDALVATTHDEFDPQGAFHGLIGLAPFEGYRISLDLREGKMILEPPVDGEDRPGLRYWTLSGQWLVPATLGEAEGLFLFDTGAAWSITSRRFARDLPGVVMEPVSGVRGFGGAVEGAWTVGGVTLRFAGADNDGQVMRAVDLSLRSRMGGAEIDGFLGRDVLDGQHWIIDTTTQRVRRLAAKD